MLLLEQNIIKKKQVKIAIELDKGDNKEYEFEAIYNSKIYVKELNNGHYLLGFYYLIL